MNRDTSFPTATDSRPHDELARATALLLEAGFEFEVLQMTETQPTETEMTETETIQTAPVDHDEPVAA
jgi:hypothetical protein